VCLNNYFVYIKRLGCVLLLVAAGAVKAESPEVLSVEKIAEPPLENRQEPDVSSDEVIVDPETAVQEVEWSDEEDEEYNIYKKHNPEDPCDRGLDTYDYEKSWYDETQIYVNSQFCEPALWFDNFFGSDRVFLEGAAGTYIRWRNDFSYDEEEYFTFNTDISFSVELPVLEDRLRLTFESDEDEALRDIAPGNDQETTNSLGLQLDVAENVRSKFNINVSFTPRVRLRYRYTYPVYETITLRLTQELQREKAVHSARTLFDFEKLFKNQLFFRSSSEAKLSEEFDGVDWLQAFVLYQRVNKKTSLSYEISANGITDPLTLATNYRAAVRFRKNFHRRWLFYEISPELTWPVSLDEDRQLIVKNRRSKWLIFFRFEVHFGNAYKKRYKDYN
jgi:hypothetical protein